MWNSLQTHKNQALLELTPLLDGWRAEARTILDQALERLPDDLSERNLDGALQSVAFRAARPVARQPGCRHHAGTGRRIPRPSPAIGPQPGTANRRRSREKAASRPQARREDERQDASHAAASPGSASSARTEVASVTRVSSEQEWEQLNKKLDQRVRQLLAEGYRRGTGLMDAELKKTLKAVTLELRHLLEGRYDSAGKWKPGDLEQRLAAIGVRRDRASVPVDELRHLAQEDRQARAGC